MPEREIDPLIGSANPKIHAENQSSLKLDPLRRIAILRRKALKEQTHACKRENLLYREPQTAIPPTVWTDLLHEPGNLHVSTQDYPRRKRANVMLWRTRLGIGVHAGAAVAMGIEYMIAIPLLLAVGGPPAAIAVGIVFTFIALANIGYAGKILYDHREPRKLKRLLFQPHLRAKKN